MPRGLPGACETGRTRNRPICQRIGDIEGGWETDALRKEEIYTIDDIYALADGERAELINGQIYNMAPPSRTHQRLSMFLASEISAYIKNNDGDCEVYAAPFGVYLYDDVLNYFEPDILVVCDPSKLDEKGCHGAPDWTIEIVSPASRRLDYFTKLFQYRTAGVREYWIVDPLRELVTVYQFEAETMEQYFFGDEVPVGIYEGFTIKVQ